MCCIVSLLISDGVRLGVYRYRRHTISHSIKHNNNAPRCRHILSQPLLSPQESSSVYSYKWSINLYAICARTLFYCAHTAT